MIRSIFSFRWVLSLRWLVLAAVLIYQPATAATDELGPRHRSTCLVQWKVQDDRFVVSKLTIDLSDRFKARVTPAQRDLLEKDLTNLLNTAMAFELPLSVWARTDAEIASYLHSGPTPISPVLAGAQEWEQASQSLASTRPVSQLNEVFSKILGYQFFQAALTEDTPLRLQDASHAADQENLAQRGQLLLVLLDPVEPADVSVDAIRFAEGSAALRGPLQTQSRAGVDRADLSRLLGPLIGQIWIEREIRVSIADYYSQRGAPAVEPIQLQRKLAIANDTLRTGGQPGMSVDDVLQGNYNPNAPLSIYGLVDVAFGDKPTRTESRRILVTEPRCVATLSLSFDGTPDPVLEQKLLYAILDQGDWEEFQRGGAAKYLKTIPAVIGDKSVTTRVLSIDALRQSHPDQAQEWVLFDEDLKRRAQLLAPMGYSVAAVEGQGRRAALALAPLPRDQAAGELAATSPEKITGEPAIAEPTEVAEENAIAANAFKPRTIEKEFRNFAQASVGYLVGQGAEIAGGYRRVLLSDRTANLTLNAGALQEMFGDAQIQKDFLFFDRLHRRLSVDLKTYSTFTPNVPQGAGLVDKRRNGGALQTDIDLFRAARGFWLVGRLSAQREQVRQTPTGGGAINSRYDSSANLGVTGFWRDSTQLNAPSLTFSADVKLAASGPLSYSVWETSARLHTPVGAFMQADASLRFAQTSGDAPLSELPRLGGASSVRGYREDAATGKSVGTATGEFWVPLRFLETRWPRLGPWIRHQFIAVFGDVGAFRDTTASTHWLAGAGIGFRIRPQPGAVVKLDLAQGLLDTGTVRGRFRTHLDVSADFPF